MPITKKESSKVVEPPIVFIQVLAYPDYKIAKVNPYTYMIYKRNSNGEFAKYLDLKFSETYAAVMSITSIEEFKRLFAIPAFNNLNEQIMKLKDNGNADTSTS